MWSLDHWPYAVRDCPKKKKKKTSCPRFPLLRWFICQRLHSLFLTPSPLIFPVTTITPSPTPGPLLAPHHLPHPPWGTINLCAAGLLGLDEPTLRISLTSCVQLIQPKMKYCNYISYLLALFIPIIPVSDQILYHLLLPLTADVLVLDPLSTQCCRILPPTASLCSLEIDLSWHHHQRQPSIYMLFKLHWSLSLFLLGFYENELWMAREQASRNLGLNGVLNIQVQEEVYWTARGAFQKSFQWHLACACRTFYKFWWFSVACLMPISYSIVSDRKITLLHTGPSRTSCNDIDTTGRTTVPSVWNPASQASTIHQVAPNPIGNRAA